jgi:hypothetical protein
MGVMCRLNGEIRNTHKIFVRKSEEKDHVGNLDIYGKIILELVLKGEDVRAWIEFI